MTRIVIERFAHATLYFGDGFEGICIEWAAET